MFAKCEMQLAASFKGGTELQRNGFYQCDLRKADFRRPPAIRWIFWAAA